VFLDYIVRGAISKRDPLAEELSDNIAEGKGLGGPAGRRRALGPSVLMAVGGMIGVAAGGRIVVGSAIDIAHRLGVPEVVIGLTLVSFGTTLPELATSIIAARRGQADLAIGNVVGSNIFNILFIGGTVATIRPVPVPEGGRADLLFLAAECVLLLPIAVRGPKRITRAEGVLMLLLYLSYMGWRTLR
jgi:cation:H+ antiporter